MHMFCIICYIGEDDDIFHVTFLISSLKYNKTNVFNKEELPGARPLEEMRPTIKKKNFTFG